MHTARSILERMTAEALLPMINLGVSGAVAAALLQVYREWQEQRMPAALRSRDRVRN